VNNNWKVVKKIQQHGCIITGKQDEIVKKKNNNNNKLKKKRKKERKKNTLAETRLSADAVLVPSSAPSPSRRSALAKGDNPLPSSRSSRVGLMAAEEEEEEEGAWGVGPEAEAAPVPSLAKLFLATRRW
jgi:hypothetical protein